MSDAVWIQMYHNTPPVRNISEQGGPDLVWCHHSWDPNMVRSALEATQSLVSDEEFKRVMHAVIAEPKMPQDMDPDMDIWKLLGSHAQFCSLADVWSLEAIADCASVGGDDTYFDYYPDYLYGLDQLCRQIGYMDPINKAVANAKATTYSSDDEDVLQGYGDS